jgi:hypothetical protein
MTDLVDTDRLVTNDEIRQRLVSYLQARHHDRWTLDEIDGIVGEELADLQDAPVQTFVETLVLREASQRLRERR